MNVADQGILKFAQALAELVGGQENAHPPVVQSARYVTIALASTLTGYSEKAIRRKIEEGVWVENREWRRAKDGHILIDMEGYERWVEQEAA